MGCLVILRIRPTSFSASGGEASASNTTTPAGVTTRLNGGAGNGSGARSSVWNHETGNSANVGGMWRHTSWTDTTNKVFTSNNGHIEIRLVQYGRPGVGTYGQLTNAWDNLHIVLKDFTTKQVLWTYDENFESYNTVEELNAALVA